MRVCLLYLHTHTRTFHYIQFSGIYVILVTTLKVAGYLFIYLMGLIRRAHSHQLERG